MFNFINEEQASDNDSGLFLCNLTTNDQEKTIPRLKPTLYRDKSSIQWYQSKEMKLSSVTTDWIENIPRDQIVTLDYNCGLVISCLSTKQALIKLKEKSGNAKVFDVLKANDKHSDLLPGEYEGGLKVWECTKDVVVHFMKNEIKEESNSLNEKLVLDLGCGSGILGIMCLLHGASVTFQDYNQEVLEAMTVPNIFLNGRGVTEGKIRLFSGDWSSFLDLISRSGDRFDYILTSETIYNPKNYKKIIAIIKTLLKPSGTCLVGAKMTYFGVGGSLKEFQAILKKEGMMSDLCWESNEGVARGVLKVKFS